MTENEAIEIINKNLCQGNLILALDVAKSSIMELQQYRAIGTIEEWREARKKKRRKEQEKALAAYKTIQNHCNNRETCDGCLFRMEDEAPGVCIMEFQDSPAEWQELELDEPAAYK